LKKTITISILIFILASCTKSTTSPVLPVYTVSTTDSITATINGTNFVFDENPALTVQMHDSMQRVLMVAYTGNNFNAKSFSIEIAAVDSVGVRNYADSSSVPGTNYAFMQYVSNLSPYTVYGSSDTIAHPFAITVTSLTPTRIAGTFTGYAYLNADTTQPQQTITNGTFTLAR
jgi:hypothetical protein